MRVTKDEVRAVAGLLPGCTALYCLDGALQRIGCSPALAALCGYTAEQLEQPALSAPLALVCEQDRPLLMARLTDCFEHSAELLTICRLVHMDGHLFGARFQACPIPLASGETILAATLVALGADDDPFLLLNHVPTGVGIYRLAGRELSPVFLNDGFYQMLGVDRDTYRSTYMETPMNAAYPADQEHLLAALLSAERDGTFSLTVRLLAAQNQLLWVQLDGRRIEQHANWSIFYISFANVDARERARAAFEKSRASLQATFSTSEVFCYEFDPIAHTAQSYADCDLFGLPAHLDNFPECLFASGLIHPDDLESARIAAREVEGGENEAECEIRMKSHGKYLWFSCRFSSCEDSEKQRRIVLCTLAGVSIQKDALLAFRNHQETVLRLNPDAIATFRINLTQDCCSDGISTYPSLAALESSGSADGLFTAAAAQIDMPAERERFAALFSRGRLLAEYEKGRALFALDHRFSLEPEATAWLHTTLDLMRNPATGDVEGILYIKNVSADVVANLMLRQALRRGYERAAVVNVRSGGYFLFDSAAGLYGVHRTHFFESGISNLSDFLAPDKLAFLRSSLTADAIAAHLAEQDTYTAVLPGQGTGHHVHRYQLLFSYIDRDQQMLLATIRDFTDNVLLEELRYSSTHDRLTDLFNRRRTFSACRRMLDAHPEETFVMAHFDIQRFRLLNSFFGEQEGDRLLCYIADLLRQAAADYDHCVFGRIEADVFCFFFPESEELLTKHRALFSRALRQFRADFFLEPSCGLYRVTDRSLSPEAMFSRASMAMRANKKKPLIHVTWYNEAMEQALAYEQQIVSDAKTAIETEQFEVYLQPKYELAGETPCGAEALVRWNHPARGLIMPGSFIPIFETNGFIMQLDRYMWEHVCALLRKWLDAGYDPAPISVNVSRVSMYSPNTVATLEGLVQDYRIPPRLLALELTESAYMDDPEEMKNRLLALQKFGFLILMDDFGSGYSSLNMLKDLPVDYLKIDMHFLSSGEDGVRSRLILASVIRMACWLQLPVITEGVETVEQAHFLRGIGCGYVQGFLFARPMPVGEYERLILHKSTVPLLQEDTQLSIMSQIITNTDFVSNYFTEHVPVPLAFIELMENDFSLIRASGEFITTFGLGQELAEGKRLVAAQALSEADRGLLLATFHKASSCGSEAECLIVWHREETQESRRFLVRARYLGRNACSSILLTAFLDVTACVASPEGGASLLPESADVPLTSAQLRAQIAQLNGLFDFVQAVYPEQRRVFSPSRADTRCFAMLGGRASCEGCLVQDAYLQNRPLSRVLRVGESVFLAVAQPMRLRTENGEITPIVLEVAMRLEGSVLRELSGHSDVPDNLRRLVYQDSLTSAYNRRYFNEMLYLPAKDAGRHALSVGFVMLDLNHFKQLNDTYGHSSGDLVLIQVSSELQRNVGKQDSVVRFGGDEFLVILVGYTQDQVVAKVAELEHAVAAVRLNRVSGNFLSAGIGYAYTAHFQTHPAAVEALLQEADQAMYAHKLSHR